MFLHVQLENSSAFSAFGIDKFARKAKDVK